MDRRFETRALRESGYELQRASGGLLKHAGAAGSPTSLSVTLAHVEEALDRLAVAMLQIAHVVATSDDEAAAEFDEIGPEARGLCVHLRKVSDGLGDAQDSCRVARMWVRRLRDAEHRPAA
jgi:hypothetical protein